MDSFGKKLTKCRKEKNLSQKDLAKLFNTSHTTIGKYERDEMTPSIEAAKKLANILDVTVGYLLSESEQENLFKDKKMLQRIHDIVDLPTKEKESLLTIIDYFLKASKVNLL